MERVKLLSMTAVLTLLIWASADSLVNETTSVSVLLDVIPPATSPDMLVSASAAATPYELEVSGSRKVVEDVQAHAPVRLRIAMEEHPTGKTILRPDRTTLRSAIGQLGAEFGKLSILSLRPDEVAVNVDHMVTREVRVTAQNLTLHYDAEPQLNRSTVAIRARESQAPLGSVDDLTLLDIGPDLERLLKDQPVGRRVTVAVPIDLRPFGPDASADPGVVEVTATVQAERTTAEIATVPILLAVSFANLEKPLRPVARDGTPMVLVTQTIRVTGLREDVARLQRGESRAQGVIQLKQEDFENVGSLNLVTPEFNLPPGITLASVPTPVEFKLTSAATTENHP